MYSRMEYYQTKLNEIYMPFFQGISSFEGTSCKATCSFCWTLDFISFFTNSFKQTPYPFNGQNLLNMTKKFLPMLLKTAILNCYQQLETKRWIWELWTVVASWFMFVTKLLKLMVASMWLHQHYFFECCFCWFPHETFDSI